MTETATPTVTRSSTGTRTSSPSLTATLTSQPNFFFSILIYNGAGEKVRTLASGRSAQNNPAMDFQLSQQGMSPGTGNPLHVTSAGVDYVWDGDNDSGQAISSGMYYLKLEYQDTFGHVESVTLSVSLIASQLQYSVKIYNSAGEELRSLPMPPSMSGMPARLKADKESLVPEQGAGEGITFDLGNGSTVNWDGNNAAGQRASNGVYLAELVVIHQGSKATIHAASVTVLGGRDDLLGRAVLATNPVTQANGWVMELRLNSVAKLTVLGRLYNLAGELVMIAGNDMDPDILVLNLGKGDASAGAYVLAVTAKAPWGTMQRRNFKIAVLK